MRGYSDALVELGNQAWILNVALAELHSFDQLTNALPQSTAMTELDQGRQQLLYPAIARLQTRLEALLSKWQRRMAEEAGQDIPISYQSWGCQVSMPESLKQMSIEVIEQQTLAQIRAQALSCADDFFIFTAPEGEVLTPDRPSSVANLIRFHGVDCTIAKMWWSWCLSTERLYCRLEPLADNLWHGDSCLLPKR